MSDTLDFLNSSPEATADSDIDIEAVRENLPNLERAELETICKELEIEVSFPSTEETMREKINDFISENDGTANVTDITHDPESLVLPKNEDATAVVPAAPPAPMVGRGNETDVPVSDTEIDNRIVVSRARYWTNPFTGNNVPHGQRDIDGRGNVDGFAVPVAAPDPIAPPPVYDGE